MDCATLDRETDERPDWTGYAPGFYWALRSDKREPEVCRWNGIHWHAAGRLAPIQPLAALNVPLEPPERPQVVEVN